MKPKPGDVIGDQTDFRTVRSLSDLTPGEVVGVDARCRQYVALAGALIVAQVVSVSERCARLDLGGPTLVIDRPTILRRIE